MQTLRSLEKKLTYSLIQQIVVVSQAVRMQSCLPAGAQSRLSAPPRNSAVTQEAVSSHNEMPRTGVPQSDACTGQPLSAAGEWKGRVKEWLFGTRGDSSRAKVLTAVWERRSASGESNDVDLMPPKDCLDGSSVVSTGERYHSTAGGMGIKCPGSCLGFSAGKLGGQRCQSQRDWWR